MPRSRNRLQVEQLQLSRAHRRGRTQLRPVMAETEGRAGDRTRTQAHCRRPARRPGRQAADHRSHERVGPHLHPGARSAGRNAPLGSRPDRQARSTARCPGRLARRGGVVDLAQANIMAEWKSPGRGHRFTPCPRGLVCADDAHRARGRVQHHQTQQRHPLRPWPAMCRKATSSLTIQDNGQGITAETGRTVWTAATAWPA